MARQREDLLLIERIAEGDELALRELYQRHGGIIYSLILKILGHAQEAEEVLQDVFVRVWRHAPNYRADRSQVFTWMVLISRRLCFDRLRTRRHRPVAVELEEVPTLGIEEDIRDHVWHGELRTQLLDRLRHLPEDQRQCLEMAFFQGLTQIEIASRLKQPLGTVKARIRRGLLRLRGLLDPHD